MNPDLFIDGTINIARSHSHKFPDEFLHWLPDNLHVWEAFVAEVKKVIERGYAHYSSRTIIEFLRHHSALKERSGEFKINNNYPPYLARLFDLVYPSEAGLFEYREVKKNEYPG